MISVIETEDEMELNRAEVRGFLKKKEELHQIDPAVLEALPPEIAAEVASQYGMQLSALSERHPKKGKIDSYFRR